jgi:hypothetical protein
MIFITLGNPSKIGLILRRNIFLTQHQPEGFNEISGQRTHLVGPRFAAIREVIHENFVKII